MACRSSVTIQRAFSSSSVLISAGSWKLASNTITRRYTSRTFSSSSVNAMASKPQNEFLVVIPDLPNTNTRRAEAQPKHIEGAMPLIDSGELPYYGVTLTKHPEEGGSHKQHISGSVIVLKAESEDQIRDFLKRDAYTKHGVWNVKEAQIWPFKSG